MSTSSRSRGRPPVAAWLGMIGLLAVLAVVVPLLLEREVPDAHSPALESRPAASHVAPLSSVQPLTLAAPVLPALDSEAIAPPESMWPHAAPAGAAAAPREVGGRVVRASDGTPLAGAIVRVLGENGPSVTTDADGLFRLPPHPGARELEVSFPRVDRSWPHRPQSFPIYGEPADGLQLAYDCGFILTGTVTDDQDRPLPHSKVSVLVSGSGLWSSRWTTADAKGRYAVPDLSPPLEVGAIAITAEADGHCPATASLPLNHAEPGVRTLDLRLSREGAIEITALDARRQPVEILMALVRTESDRIIECRSREAGVARVGRLPTGRHSVAVVAQALPSKFEPDPEPLAAARIEDILVEPGRITPVEIVLQPGASVSGRVTDHSGLPLDGAQVWFEAVEPDAGTASQDTPVRRYDRAAARLRLRNGGARTGRSTAPGGLFVLQGLPAGPVRIVAEAAGRARASTVVDLTPGERRERVDLTLWPGVELRGRVQLADGSPMQFCTSVFVLPADPDSNEVLAVGETRFEGTFSVHGLEPGPKRVLVVGADGSWVEQVVDPSDEPQTFVAR